MCTGLYNCLFPTVCFNATCHSLVHVILFLLLAFRKIAPGKKKNERCSRLRRDQCFTIRKQPSMLSDKREEIVPKTASSPLLRRPLLKRPVHVPRWFFPFTFRT